MPSLRFLPCLVVAAALALAAPDPARAQSDDERAHAHFLAGRSYFDQRRYEDAAEQFQEAYRLSQRAVLLINVSTSLERAGHPAEAADALEQYLAVVPEAEDRATLEERIRQLRLAAERDRAQPADDPPEDTTPPPPAEDAPERDGDTLGAVGMIGIVIAGIGAAAGIAAIGTGVAATDVHGSLESRCGPEGLDCPAGFESDVERGKSLSFASTALLPVSLVALGVGAVLIVVGLEQASEVRDDAAVSVRLAPGPGEVGLGLEARFF